MSHRLQKYALYSETGGSPAIPYQPAYCVETTVSVPNTRVTSGGGSLVFYSDPMSSGSMVYVDNRGTGGSQTIGGSSVTTQTQKSCYPAVQGTPAVDPIVVTDPQLGWNSGARSIDVIAEGDDGYISFGTAMNVAGVLAGISPTTTPETSTSPYDCTHAFHISTTYGIRVYERSIGYTQILEASYPATIAGDTEFRIERRSGLVEFYVNDRRVHIGATRSTDEICLDASLYRAGDYVENPYIGPLLAAAGEIDMQLTLPTVRFSNFTIAEFYFDILLPTVDLTLHNNFSIAAVTPAITTLFSDHPYGEIEIVIPMAETEFSGGVVPVDYSMGILASMPAMIGYLHGIAGGVGSYDLSIPATNLIFSGRNDEDPEYGYASIGTIEDPVLIPSPLYTWLDDGFGSPNIYETHQVLVFNNTFSSDPLFFAEISGGIEAGETFTIWEVSDNTIAEGVSLTDTYTFSELLYALIASGVTITNTLPAGAIKEIQYSVNAATGALTTYRNFGFTAFQRIDNETFGIKSDGLYRLRAGDDDGTAFDAVIDFGDTDFDGAERKNVDSLYLGLSNDGAVYARLTNDNGGEHYYQVTQNAPTARVIAGRGTFARRWGLRLDIIDAANLELDNVEFSVGVSVRRRMP